MNRIKKTYLPFIGLISLSYLLYGCSTITSQTPPPSLASHILNKYPPYVPREFEKQFHAQGVNYGMPFGSATFLGHTPPFAGVHVTRATIAPPFTLPNNYPLGQGIYFHQSLYEITDSWSGFLWNHPFTIQIIRKRSSSFSIIVERENNQIKKIIKINKPVIQIINFTGNYMVFIPGVWLSGTKEPYEALNLLTGQLLVNGTKPMYMTGCFPCMGAHSAYISGLPTKYSNAPRWNALH